jgi:hypothetical protein
MRTTGRTSRLLLAGVAAALLLGRPAVAADRVPVRVRVLEGSKKEPARFDPRLEDLKRQLSPLSYVRWEQKSERELTMEQGKQEWVTLPNGDPVGLTLVEVRKDGVTFEVALSAQNTQSRLSVERGQRIVHQVTREKDGAALFMSATAWP